MKTLCVFCGSQTGAGTVYADVARQVGELLAKQDITLVYGAGNVGLMGIVANACLEHGGHVIGVIPKHLVDMEVCHHDISDLRIVETMQERKMLMLELSDAFLAMPGGIGTIDELFEMLTLNQLDIQEKPCGLLNTNAYYDHLIQFLDKMTSEQFLGKSHRDLLLIDNSPEKLLKTLKLCHK